MLGRDIQLFEEIARNFIAKRKRETVNTEDILDVSSSSLGGRSSVPFSDSGYLSLSLSLSLCL